jgi:PelA/Pel-15E family pectate lyase
MIKKIIFIISIVCGINFPQSQSELQLIKSLLSEFENSSRHWYEIKDTDKVILPEKNQKRYSDSDYIKIADNILLFQKLNGGWPKNYDMQAVLSSVQYSKILDSKSILNTCFDNSTTFSHINYLIEVFRLTKKEKYKNSILSGLTFLINSQYSNGGWPQFYPDTSGYRKYITYNDGAMIGIMRLLKNIIETGSAFSFISSELKTRIIYAYDNGIDCIINSQIKINDTLYVWCQQHDNITFLPQNARTFEPAAICNGESADIVNFLMSIKNPDEKIITAIKSAVRWFEESKITGIRIKTIDAPYSEYEYRNISTDKILISDDKAEPIWTRYYDLKTRLPIFCNRDGHIVNNFNEVERERRVGYAWYVYDPQKVLDNYYYWLSQLNEK